MSQLAFNLLSASVLVAIVLLVRRPVGRMFGARASYALWLAPAIRLVMPQLPQFAVPAAATPAGAVDWALMIEPATRVVATNLDRWPVMWAVGAALFLTYHLICHMMFLRRALSAGCSYGGSIEGCEILMTSAVEGPAATGLIRRRILLPVDFETRFTHQQQQIAMLHEALHHRRGDLWASAAALLGAATLWFNPLTYLALGAFRRDMESACDASVLATPGAVDVAAYGDTILRSAAHAIPRSLCALTSLDELKGRLIMLNTNHGLLRRFAGFGVAGGLALAGIACTAPASADEPTKEHRTVEKRIIIHNDGDGTKSATWNDGKEMKIDCPGELTVIEAGSAKSKDKEEKAKMVFCAKSKDPAEAAAGLQKAIAEMNKDSDMDPDLKAQVIAKIEARIAELNAKK